MTRLVALRVGKSELIHPLLLLTIIWGQPSFAVQPLPVWTAEEVLRIGSLDGSEDAFDQPSRLLVGRDGDVFVPEPRLRMIRRFGADGRVKPSIGQLGDGPGEFRRVGAAGFLGDTLWAFDPATRRVTLFDGDGVPLESWLVDPGDMQRGSGSVSMSHLLPGRVHLIDQVTWSPASGPTGPMTRTILRWDPASGESETVLSHPVDGGVIPVEGYGIISFQPVRDDPIRLADPWGQRILTVERPVATARGGPAEFRISFEDFDRSLLSARRISYAPRPFPEIARDSIFRTALEDLGTGMPRGVVESALRDGLFLPGFLPPVSRVYQAPHGGIWLQREMFQEAPPRVLILDEELRPEAELRLAHEPQYIAVAPTGDYFWTIETDELDVAYVVRYRIRR